MSNGGPGTGCLPCALGTRPVNATRLGAPGMRAKRVTNGAEEGAQRPEIRGCPAGALGAAASSSRRGTGRLGSLERARLQSLEHPPPLSCPDWHPPLVVENVPRPRLGPGRLGTWSLTAKPALPPAHADHLGRPPLSRVLSSPERAAVGAGVPEDPSGQRCDWCD